MGDKFIDALTSRWTWIIENNEDLKNWMRRWNFLIELDPKYKLSLTSEKVREALVFAAFNKTSMKEVLEENLPHWLESVLDKEVIRILSKEVPAQFQAATGHYHKIHYTESEPPYVEVRLQEMFGVTQNPKLGFGKLPLTFKLLAPNYRPTQVTSDIANFWKTTYFEVRKELRSRYPKHSWPDDPLSDPPVAKGTRRRPQ